MAARHGHRGITVHSGGPHHGNQHAGNVFADAAPLLEDHLTGVECESLALTHRLAAVTDVLSYPVQQHFGFLFVGSAVDASLSPVPASSAYVCGLIDLRNPTAPFYGTNGPSAPLWNPPMSHEPSWTADNLGMLFGSFVVARTTDQEKPLQRPAAATTNETAMENAPTSL